MKKLVVAARHRPPADSPSNDANRHAENSKVRRMYWVRSPVYRVPCTFTNSYVPYPLFMCQQFLCAGLSFRDVVGNLYLLRYGL